MTARTPAQLRSHRQKLREATSSFRFLIASPHDMAADPILVLPAGARLAISHSIGLGAGQVTITTEGGRSWTHKALAADSVALGNWHEDNARVTQVGAPVGTLSLYVQNPLDGTFALIATQIIG